MAKSTRKNRTRRQPPKAFTEPVSKKTRYFRPTVWISTLDVSTGLKKILMRLNDFTVRLYGKVLKVGKKVLEIIANFYRRFPKTSIAILLSIALVWLVGLVPVLGPLLQALAMILGVGLTYFAFFKDLFMPWDSRGPYGPFMRQFSRRLGFLAG